MNKIKETLGDEYGIRDGKINDSTGFLGKAWTDLTKDELYIVISYVFTRNKEIQDELDLLIVRNSFPSSVKCIECLDKGCDDCDEDEDEEEDERWEKIGMHIAILSFLLMIILYNVYE